MIEAESHPASCSTTTTTIDATISSSSSRSSSASPQLGRTALELKLKLRGEEHASEIRQWLEQFPTDSNKIDALIQQHATLVQEKRIMHEALKEQQNMYNELTEKQEKMQLEADRTMLAKLKLETLCRELQKCNKQVKEENVERLKQMEQSRQDMVDQFKASLSDIQKSMDAGKERSERLSADNQQLASKLRELANQYEDKLKCLADQYEQKHKYAQQLATTKDMELQLADAKLDACKLNLEKSQQQKAQLEQLLIDRDTLVHETTTSEQALRLQIGKYSEKYDQLHKSLSSSNETFDRFKSEMERMNGSLIKVERESRKWKDKFEEASQTLQSLVTQKKTADQTLAQKQRQLDKLEQLCRKLTEERTELIKQLKETSD